MPCPRRARSGDALVFGGFALRLATGELAYVAAGLALLAAGGAAAVALFPHVAARVEIWQRPFADELRFGASYQLVQGLFALAGGGLFGAGLGGGMPEQIPVVWSDFVFDAFAEEAGFAGVLALLAAFLLLAHRGLAIALHAPTTFLQLLAGGLAASFALQTLVIVATPRSCRSPDHVRSSPTAARRSSRTSCSCALLRGATSVRARSVNRGGGETSARSPQLIAFPHLGRRGAGMLSPELATTRRSPRRGGRVRPRSGHPARATDGVAQACAGTPSRVAQVVGYASARRGGISWPTARRSSGRIRRPVRRPRAAPRVAPPGSVTRHDPRRSVRRLPRSPGALARSSLDPRTRSSRREPARARHRRARRSRRAVSPGRHGHRRRRPTLSTARRRASTRRARFQDRDRGRALEVGVLTRRRRSASTTLPGRPRGAYAVRSEAAHGDFDLSLAMARSENIYFAKAALATGGAPRRDRGA